MSNTFRYLKIMNGFQKATLFSGFKETGFWEVNTISPVVLNIAPGESKSVPISITRTEFTEESIQLQLLNLPSGMVANFQPNILSSGQTSAVLNITNNTALPSTTTGVVVAGIPAPRKVGQFSITTPAAQPLLPYWEFGIPFEYIPPPTTTEATTTTAAPPIMPEPYYQFITSCTDTTWTITLTSVASRGTIPPEYIFEAYPPKTKTITVNREAEPSSVWVSDIVRYSTNYPDGGEVIGSDPERPGPYTGGAARNFDVPALGTSYSPIQGSWSPYIWSYV